MLTRQGARRLTSMLDRIASVIQDHPGVLGINNKIAKDFAYRCDLLSDAIETRAVQNFPRQASEDCESCGEFADEEFEEFEEAARKNTPPSYAKPDCGPDASSQEWGMKDSRSPTYHKNYDKCYHAVNMKLDKTAKRDSEDFEDCESCGEFADEEFEEAARKNTPPSYAKPDCGPDASSQEWGMKDSRSPTYHKNYDKCYHAVNRKLDKTANRNRIAGTDRKAWFDPATIADEVPGPLEHLDDDEQWIDDHFTQERFDELQTVQEDGDLGPQPYITPAGKTASHHGFRLTSK